MKNVLLVCSFGMSTSFLTKKMNDLAKEKKVPLIVYAKSENAIETELEKADCILIVLRSHIWKNRSRTEWEEKSRWNVWMPRILGG